MRLEFVSVFLCACLLVGCSNGTKVLKTSVAPEPLLVDEYAELDDAHGAPAVADAVIRKRLDQARAHYLHALKAVEGNREKVAAQHFEAAIAILNNMMTHPDIGAMQEYTRLSRSVIRDYEGKITSIENLDSASSFFVLREKMFEEIELLPVSFRPAEEEALDIVAIDSLVIGLPENEAVQQTLDYFTNGRGRKYMGLWLQRSGRYFPLYEKILAEEGAPDELKYLSMIESGLSPRATSHAAAVGLWQFIASTGRAYGMHADWYRDERRDPEKATRAAARYLLDLYDQMGDWHLALGSYNCGPGRMRKALRRSDSVDYWEARKHLPRETARYVPLYVAAAKIARDPAAYGFTDIVLDRPFEFDVVPVYAPYQLSTIAEIAGVGVDVLKDLNPELLQEQVPPGEALYELRVPPGMGMHLTRILDTLTVGATNSMSWKRHKVRSGETVTKIARKYGVSVSEVLEANDMTSKSTLLRGTTLKIPSPGMSEAITAEMIAERKAKAEELRIEKIAEERAKMVAEKSTSEASTPSIQATPADTRSTTDKTSEVAGDVGEDMITAAPTAERKHTQSDLTSEEPPAPSAESTPKNTEGAEPIFVNVEASAAPEAAPEEEPAQQAVTTTEIEKPVETTPSQTLAVTTDEIPTAENSSAVVTDSPEITDATPVAAEQHEDVTEEIVEVAAAREERAELLESDVAESPSEAPKPGATVSPALASALSAPVGMRQIPSTPPNRTRRYKVRRGETLSDIAAKFSVTVRELQEANPRLGSNGVSAGQVIVVR